MLNRVVVIADLILAQPRAKSAAAEQGLPYLRFERASHEQQRVLLRHL